ncbi:MAG: hypothetical protein KJI71_01295 [Patescibacteria group bacterium]|nr:hypothetical protein [Patescibacteria group bacterium]
MKVTKHQNNDISIRFSLGSKYHVVMAFRNYLSKNLGKDLKLLNEDLDLCDAEDKDDLEHTIAINEANIKIFKDVLEEIK